MPIPTRGNCWNILMTQVALGGIRLRLICNSSESFMKGVTGLTFLVQWMNVKSLRQSLQCIKNSFFFDKTSSCISNWLCCIFQMWSGSHYYYCYNGPIIIVLCLLPHFFPVVKWCIFFIFLYFLHPFFSFCFSFIFFLILTPYFWVFFVFLQFCGVFSPSTWVSTTTYHIFSFPE